jgi:hypothetical protein
MSEELDANGVTLVAIQVLDERVRAIEQRFAELEPQRPVQF